MFWVVVTVGYLDAFISCMLVAPHTPTYSGRGGLWEGGELQFKVFNSNHLATLGLHVNLAGVFSPQTFTPIAGCIVFKYCESTRMLMSLLVLRCYVYFLKCLRVTDSLNVFHDGLERWEDLFCLLLFCFFTPSQSRSSAGQSNNCSILNLCDDMHLKFK